MKNGTSVTYETVVSRVCILEITSRLTILCIYMYYATLFFLSLLRARGNLTTASPSPDAVRISRTTKGVLQVAMSLITCTLLSCAIVRQYLLWCELLTKQTITSVFQRRSSPAARPRSSTSCRTSAAGPCWTERGGRAATSAGWTRSGGSGCTTTTFWFVGCCLTFGVFFEGGGKLKLNFLSFIGCHLGGAGREGLGRLYSSGAKKY